MTVRRRMVSPDDDRLLREWAYGFGGWMKAHGLTSESRGTSTAISDGPPWASAFCPCRKHMGHLAALQQQVLRVAINLGEY